LAFFLCFLDIQLESEYPKEGVWIGFFIINFQRLTFAFLKDSMVRVMIARSDFRHYKFSFANARPGRPRKHSHRFLANSFKEAYVASIRLRYFTSPATLRSIEPARLLQLLGRFRDFFDSVGHPLPPLEAPEQIDYQVLSGIFVSPNESMPGELLEVLFLVDEMSDPNDMETLLNAAAKYGVELDAGTEQSVTDLAVQIWLRNPEVLELQHALKQYKRPKSFEYFQGSRTAIDEFMHPSTDQMETLQRELDDWFANKRRGRGAKLLVTEDSDEVRFLIRHGRPFAREASLKNTEVESVCYRPATYDVVIYDRRLHELRINADLIGEKKLYCKLIGTYFFSNPDCFPGLNKYCLEPLRNMNTDSLQCFDTEGIESVKLIEIQFQRGGPHGLTSTVKAGNLLETANVFDNPWAVDAEIIKAVFSVKFVGSKSSRSVTIRSGNKAQYARDSDASLIEQWMELRGFVQQVACESYEEADLSVANA
jgi:hypothetical protein